MDFRMVKDPPLNLNSRENIYSLETINTTYSLFFGNLQSYFECWDICYITEDSVGGYDYLLDI